MIATSPREPASTAAVAAATAGRVLVVDDHRQARESMAEVLRTSGHQVACCSSAAEALQVLQSAAFDCIVTDLKMPGMSGLELIVQLRQRRTGAQVVMVTAHATVSSAVEAMRHGAFDYIEKPFDADALERLVAQAIRHGRLVRPEAASACPGGAEPVMLGSSPAMQALRARIAQVAPTPETVLISGESGTGKELVARALHAASPRQTAPLVSLNCPVLSAHLMESELFGHERGAFTGADAPRIGRFESAHGGTILLDEVTEIDLGLQAKLLRVLQEKSFERVGSCKTIHVDVRVLATTNRSLQAAVAAGRFREDLYFRLAVVPLRVPPLRERRQDIAELIQYFFRRAAQRLEREPAALEPAAESLLLEYHWPGNVRELENLITRASVLGTGGAVGADELRRWLIAPPGDEHKTPCDAIPVGISLEEMERRLIQATLAHFGGHREKTAKALGIGVRTLSGKLRLYGYAPREKFVATPDPATAVRG
jgi:DNA-binding NtrC family response regulator